MEIGKVFDILTCVGAKIECWRKPKKGKNAMFDRQTKKFCSAVVDALPDLSEEVMQGWIGNPRALKLTLEGVLCPSEEAGTASAQGATTTRPTFSLMINPALSLENRIKAGNYNWHDGDLLKWKRKDASIYTGNEPVAVEAEYFHFNKTISTPEAERQIDEAGYRPGNFEELTAHGEQNPEEQWKYPIIALQSVFVDPRGGSLDSPYLGESDAERDLGLDYRGGGWSARWRFLAVRK